MWKSKRFNIKSWFRNNRELATLPFVLVVVFALMAGLAPSRFLKGSNFQSMAIQLPEVGLFALAMMITLLTGGINLSVITTANLSGIIGALILKSYCMPTDTGLSTTLIMILAIAASLAVSLLLGLINGFLIAHVGVSAILATLGTMTLYDGLGIAITKGYVVSNFPKCFLYIGTGTVAGVPVALLIFIVSAYLMSLILARKPFGLSTYMIGSNERATKFSGVNVKSVLMKTYLLSGFLSGIASIIMTSRFNSANAGYGSSYLLVTVLIAVLGGVDPFGGFGKVSGLVMALVILQFISSGLNLLGVTAFITISLWGTILIMVMGLNNYLEKRRFRSIKKGFSG
jgi:simple sugar transport system permease protein